MFISYVLSAVRVVEHDQNCHTHCLVWHMGIEAFSIYYKNAALHMKIKSLAEAAMCATMRVRCLKTGHAQNHLLPNELMFIFKTIFLILSKSWPRSKEDVSKTTTIQI